MRIISGIHKGFRFPTKSLPHVRPTTDRAKEALFSILNARMNLEDIAVLDIFAGMGTIGFEFLSRGASEVTFLDNNKKSIAYISEIKNQLKAENAYMKTVDVFKYLQQKCTTTYDVIFGDAPYGFAQLSSIPSLVFSENWLAPEGLLILEHPSNVVLENNYLKDVRTYGQSSFSFFYI